MSDPVPASIEPQPPPEPPRDTRRRRLGCLKNALIGCGMIVFLLTGYVSCAYDAERIVKLYKEIEAQLGYSYDTPYARDENDNIHEVFILTGIDPNMPFGKAGLHDYDEPVCGTDELPRGLYEAQGKTLRFTVRRNRADIVRTWNLDVSGPPDAPDLVDVTITLPDGTQAVRRVREAGEKVTVEVAVPILKLSDDPALLRKGILPFIKVKPCGDILEK